MKQSPCTLPFKGLPTVARALYLSSQCNKQNKQPKLKYGLAPPPSVT